MVSFRTVAHMSTTITGRRSGPSWPRAPRAHAIAIGEDLGTVDPWVREYLAGQGVLGTMMLWFAHAADGTPLRPAQWRRACMATVGTHEVPPVFGFVTGEQLTVRARLGLLKTSGGPGTG